MKQFCPIALLLLATAGSLQAQDFRPFRAGLTYQYSEATTSGDTVHTLRLAPGTRVGADSVFRFSSMAIPARSSNTAFNCYMTHISRADNLFGATLTVAASGEVRLAAANGRALTLRPRAGVGQSWLALAPALTATLSSRALGQVLGQPDSVTTITLSNGQQLRLSKRYGLLEGPAVIALLSGRYAAKALRLTALPELGLGTSKVGARVIFDFQPGDVFLRHYTSEGMFNMLCQETWIRDSVLTRSTNPSGNVTTYTFWQRRLHRGYGVMGAPPGFCSGGGTSFSPPTTFSMVVSDQMDSPMASLTGGFYQYAPASSGNGEVVSSGVRSLRFTGRHEQQATRRVTCRPQSGDSLLLSIIIDAGGSRTFAAGLGEVSSGSGGIYYNDRTQLVGYRKGTETWGSLISFRQLLPTATAKAAATTTAAPNPFTQEFTVSFELARPQAVALELRDALGRVVLARPATLMAAGAGQLPLATAGLAPGLYMLWLKPAQEPAQVLRVVKAH